MPFHLHCCCIQLMSFPFPTLLLCIPVEAKTASVKTCFLSEISLQHCSWNRESWNNEFIAWLISFLLGNMKRSIFDRITDKVRPFCYGLFALICFLHFGSESVFTWELTIHNFVGTLWTAEQLWADYIFFSKMLLILENFIAKLKNWNLNLIYVIYIMYM